MRRRLLALSFALVLPALVAPVQAGAKGPIDVRVCGAEGCELLKNVDVPPELTGSLFQAQARPDAAPSSSSGWIDVTMWFGSVPERFALFEDPAYIRAIGKREGIIAPGEKDGVYGWLRLTPEVAAAARELTEGVEPLPISELPALRATAPELAATEVEVVAPTGEDDSVPGAVWVVLAVAALTLLILLLAISGRRRRPQPAV